MKILGITAEYNPFHNGHRYHLQRSMEMTGADYSVAVMSGSFTQRGEPAALDKWTRSRLAVQNGVDLVLELPFLYACSRGEIFASGAVDILRGIGATHISFGSESGDLEALQGLVTGMRMRSGEIDEIRLQEMQKGDSFVRSLQRAVEKVLGASAAQLMAEPNNILAIEYLKRIDCWNSMGLSDGGCRNRIEPCTVKRFGSGYGSRNEEAGFAGATVLRKMVADGVSCSDGESADRGTAAGDGSAADGGEDITAGCSDAKAQLADILSRYMPSDSAEALAGAGSREAAEHNEFVMLQGELMRTGSSELSTIYCMGEGLENKFKKEIVRASSMAGFISSMVSKRYTEAAIRRLTTYVLMGIRGYQPEMKPYARVLAAGVKGRELLKFIKKEELATIPVITNINKQEDDCSEVHETLRHDILSADLYNIIMQRSLYDFSDRVMMPYIER